MYPMKFHAVYYEKPWGGRGLEKYKADLPEGKVGESWEIACHANGMSVVANGAYAGKTLEEIIGQWEHTLLGTAIDPNHFPLLLKFIHAQEALSVQVHPSDMEIEGSKKDTGKTEAWYIMDTKPEAYIILGTKGCTKDQLRVAAEAGDLEEYVRTISVSKGEIYFVESGMVHAIGPGVTLLEIQQNSDITYRVYDYDRGRELHLEQALEVINFDLVGRRNVGLSMFYKGYCKTYACVCPHFSLELYQIEEKVVESSDPERFYLFTCLEGAGEITYEKGKIGIKAGESIFIPATLGEYCISGKVKLIKTYVPNLEKIKEEIQRYMLERK